MKCLDGDPRRAVTRRADPPRDSPELRRDGAGGKMGKPILLLDSRREKLHLVVEGETVSRWGASFKKVQREGTRKKQLFCGQKVGAVGIALCENIAIEIETIFR